ncbi:MAG: acyltransferase family protein [Candidatus Angelobacter sp.]
MRSITSHLRRAQSSGYRRNLHVKIEFNALTSLRGIAASCTVLLHLLSIWAGVFPAFKNWVLFRSFALHSYLFVDFFFVLSGFVMTHAYGRVFVASVSMRDYKKFMLARFARVYPLHIVVLLVYVALAAAGVKQTEENPNWSVTANVLLVHAMGFFSRPTWNQPSWSISVEWWTYIVFPFAAAFAHRYARKIRTSAFLVLGMSLFAVLAQYFGSADLTVGFAFIRCLIGFFSGSCLYLATMNKRAVSGAGIIGNGALVTVVLAFIFAPSPLADIVSFAAFCVLIYAVSSNSKEKQWLDHPALVWIGDISYSIYLWHGLLLHVFAKALGTISSWSTVPQQHQVAFFLTALLVFEICILVLAHLSYKFIELPARNILRRRNQKGVELPVVIERLPQEANTANG